MSEALDPSGSNTAPPKLRVAFLIDRWDPQRGGAERAMAQLAEHLIARGHHVLAIALEHAQGAPGEHVRTKSFGVTRSMRERMLARNLCASAREHRADVTIGIRHLYECDLYWPHGGAHRVTLDALARVKHQRQHAQLRGRHATFVELERELLERGGARVIACVSQLVLDELAQEYPACRERLVLVENGVDLSKFDPSARATAGAAFRRELGLRDATPLLAFAARNPMLKGAHVLFGALCVFLTQFGDGPDRHSDLDWHLVVAGSDRSTWKVLKHVPEIDSRVTWREHVDPIALWSAADLCVLPTLRDTSGLVILEALACGTPVITTTSAGAHDLITPNSGSVIAPDDPMALFVAIKAWLTRIRAGDVDRDTIRACVAHRDSATWLAKLEALVLDLAATKHSR